jgi:alkaline phosphatase D
LLGEQGDHDAFIWAHTPDVLPLTVTVFKPDGALFTKQTLTPKSEDAFCVIFHVTGLDMDGTYEYKLSSAHGETERFRMRRPPPPDGRRVRIVYGSCIQQPEETATILAKMKAEGANLAMLVGDNTYFQAHDDGTNDWDNERLMMSAHLRWRKAQGMRELCGNVSTLAIWDDHDYGDNDIGFRNPSKQMALHCFKRMWAQRHYGLPTMAGIFSTVRCGPAQIFLLDVRYHRLRGKVIHDVQMEWLKKQLRGTDAPVKLIVSGSQMLPEAAVERNWECWRRDGKDQLKDLFTFLAEESISGVVLISGDVHLGQLMFSPGRKRADEGHGGDLWELTSSPLTGVTDLPVMHGDKKVYDKYMIQEAVVPNYGLIDINLDNKDKEIALELKSVDRSLFRVEVGLKSLRSRTARPPKVRAFGSGRSHTHAVFFRGDKFVSYDLVSRKVIGLPEFTFSHWPGNDGTFDAGIHWPGDRTYFFTGNGFRGWGHNVPPEWIGIPFYISANFHWPIEFQTGIDAALLWSDGKAYIFKGEEYIRYDIATETTDGNYPQPIGKRWKGVWPKGIDSVFHGPNGKVFFFRGDEYIQYDIQNDSADGPPKLIAGDWPGLTF